MNIIESGKSSLSLMSEAKGDVAHSEVETSETNAQEVLDRHLPELHPSQKKPYLGGYRDTTTGQIILHAQTQTLFANDLRPRVEKNHRDSQTVDTPNRVVDMTRHVAIQTCLTRGLYQSNGNDRVLIVKGHFETAEQLHERRVKAAIRIQTFFRHILAIKHVIDKKEKKRLRDDFLAKQYARVLSDGAEADTIEDPTKSKAISKKEFQVQTKLQDLDQVGYPTKYHRLHRDEVVQIDNPEKKRSRHLRSLFDHLTNYESSHEERIKLLMNIKYTVLEFEGEELVREIVYLIDREIDWLGRGRKDNVLDGLRKRLEIMFLKFIMNPQFNPAIERYGVKHDESTTLLHCSSCDKYRSPEHFDKEDLKQIFEKSEKSYHSTLLRYCKECQTKHKLAVLDVNDRGVKRILQLSLKRDNELQKDLNTILKSIPGCKAGEFAKETEKGEPPKIGIKDLAYAQLHHLLEKIFQSENNADEERILIRWNIMLPLTVDNSIYLSPSKAREHVKRQAEFLIFEHHNNPYFKLVKKVDELLTTIYGKEHVDRILEIHHRATEELKSL